MQLIRCTATSSKKENNHSVGFNAGTGGYLECESCEASGWHHGFLATNGGGMWLARCTSEANHSGLLVALGGAATADDCEFARDTGWAVNAAQGGSVLLLGCTLRESVYGCCAIANGAVAFRRDASRIIGCSKAAMHSKGGGTFDGLKPTLTDNRGEFNLVPATTPADQVFFWE